MLLPLLLSLALGSDQVFWRGNIYTGDSHRPRAQAVVVRNGRFIFIGSDLEVGRFIAKGTHPVNLDGATVLPGLTDSHFHIAGVGAREMTFNLEGVPSLRELQNRLKAEVGKHKAGEWVTGRGWIENSWVPQEFPTRYDLDQVSPDNPVYLVRADGHAGIANSKALEVAGVTSDTKDPFGGKINRDKDGKPTGMLLDGAQGLVGRKIVEESVDAEQALIKGAEFAAAHGLCELQVAGSSWSEREMLRRLVGAGKIKVRIYDDVYGPGPDADRLIREGPIVGERFTNRGIKVIFDGALGSRGAALLKSYEDVPTTSGFYTAKPEQVAPMLAKALHAGIQVETHAIGDRANREVLDLYEAAFKGAGKAARWRIEHAQILDPADIPRFGRLGVIASMQPSHAIGDLHFAPKRLGMKRLAGAYAWNALLKTGAIIAAGSDAPVERGDPRIEFYAAVGRRDLKGYTGPGWHPEQAVTREQAFKMLTIWPAYAAFEEKIKGTIQVGKLADMTVLGADIMRIPLADIPTTTIRMTVVGGEIIYRG